MSLAEGMDVARVRAIAGRLGADGERLRDVRGRGGASMQVLDAVWEGTDTGRFAERWATSAGQLEAAAAALRDAHLLLMREADQQDDASAGSGSGGATGLGPKGSPDSFWDRVGDFFDDLFEDVEDAWEEINDIDPWEGPREVLEDAWDWAGDRWNDAVEWGRDGLEWLGDRARDGWDAVTNFWDEQVVSRWDAAWAGLERLGPSITNFVGQFTQIFTEGRWPRFHEVAASAILLLGRAGGLVGNIIAGEDLGLFDSGTGVARSPDQLATTNADGDGTGRMPTDLVGLFDMMTDTYDNGEGRDGSDNRHVRITEVVQPDGSVAYIVNVPGTNGLFDFPGSITGGDEAFDNTSNLELQAGQQSASMEAVRDAMEQAGIPPGAPVMLMGHSQGGMVAGELVTDPSFTDQYNVTHLITEGSPNDSRAIPPGIQTLAVEHTNDIVPQVDLGDAYAGPPIPIATPFGPAIIPMTPIPNFDPAFAGSGDHVTQVRVEPNPGVEPFGVSDDMNAHHYQQYTDTVQRELDAGNPDLTAFANDPGLDIYLTDDPSQVTITEYETARE